MTHPTSVCIVVGGSATGLEQFASRELCTYVEVLFGATTLITDKPASPSTVGLFVGTAESLESTGITLPRLSEQGFVIRHGMWKGHEVLFLIGGSPKAVLWSVYELVELWGVRYLLHGDAFPQTPGNFWPREEEIVREPVLPIRQWRVINDFACGPESWGLADYRPILDQLAKLKFNRLLLSLWPWQPFVHYEHKGIKRSSAYLWFDYHYPITDDMIGRELFGEDDEFWNPDIPHGVNYDAMMAAGQQHVRELMNYAHQRGMECLVTADLTHFMPEFAPLLSSGQTTHQLSNLTIGPGPETPVEDSELTELASTVLKATIDTYPEADAIALSMPEFRQWTGQFETAWKELDHRYAIECLHPLKSILEDAAQRSGYPGGAERALDEVKGDIVALYFYARLLRELSVVEGTLRPNMPFVLTNVAEELFPILARLLPRGWETMNFVDYTPARTLKRRDVLAHIPDPAIPASLIYTLHDDNVGVLPQLATSSLYGLTQDLYRYGWAGFTTRYWLIGDHDPCIAYLSKAAWDRETRPEEVYRDQIESLWGDSCIEDMLTVFREVEAATVLLEWHGLGLTFPVPGMMMKHWVPGGFSSELMSVRHHYQIALEAAARVPAKSRKTGKGAAEYWVGRCKFGIAYLDSLEAVRKAATAEQNRRPKDALHSANEALAATRRALEAYANIARDQSDRGAIATMNEYVFRPLRDKVARMKEV